MTGLTFTHLVTKKPVTVTRELIMSIMPAESLGGTYILGNGGAIVPVSETPDEVTRLVYKVPSKGKTGPKGGAK